MAGLKRRKPATTRGLFSITISLALTTIAVSAANNNPSDTMRNIPKSILRQRRAQVTVTAFPQNIERGVGSTTTPEDEDETATVIESKNDRRGWPTPAPVASPTPAPVTRSTPAPVPRPTPAPVPRPTPSPVSTVNAIQQSATVPPKNPPPTPNPLTPWLDELDPDFEIEITPVDNNSNSNSNNNNNNIDEEYEQPPSPFFGDYCDHIQDQNHTAMLNKQESGLAGPTYLYIVEVFVVHDETLLKEDVPEYLDALNVPVALSVSGCSKQGHRKLESNTTDAAAVVVEYAEIESWKTSTETTIACEPSPPTEGLVCSVYRSRLIVFLVDNGNKSAEERRDEFETLAQSALDEQTQGFITNNPGIFAFSVHSIDALTLAANNNNNAGDGVAVSANSARNSNSSPWLSEKEKVVVGSVAACIGGLLIGMICMVRWRKSSRCQNAKHMQMNDNDDDDASQQTEEWSPPKSLNTSGPYSPSEIQEDLERTYAMTHRGDSFLNRENSLLDDPNARRSVEPRRGVTLQDRRRLHPSFDDEYHYDDRDYVMDYNDEPPFCNSNCSAERPCSAATCRICENFRTSGIDRGEYLWLKELIPESPVRVPSFDPDRPCLCSDTVQL